MRIMIGGDLNEEERRVEGESANTYLSDEIWVSNYVSIKYPLTQHKLVFTYNPLKAVAFGFIIIVCKYRKYHHGTPNILKASITIDF